MNKSESKIYDLLKDLKERREDDREQRKRQKQLQKEMETIEEKRARRIRKKEEKERKRKEKLGWDEDHLSYTNSDNPFGDSNLLSKFVWKKKLEKEGLTNLSKHELDRLNRRKLEENRRELEKVKKRRMEREQERKRREEEQLFLQRCKESAQLDELRKQDDRFHLENARLRSEIRIKEGRPKPIDLLAQYIHFFDMNEFFESIDIIIEPNRYLDNLQLNDLEDLEVDIDVYKCLENGKHDTFWNEVMVLVRYLINKLKRDNSSTLSVTERSSVHMSIKNDILDMLKKQSTDELVTLRNQIQDKIDSKYEGLDISYWETLLSEANVQLARSQLQDIHNKILKKQFKFLNNNQKNMESVKINEKESLQVTKPPLNNNNSEMNLIEICETNYKNNNYSPKLVKIEDVTDDFFEILDENEYNKRIELERKSILNKNRSMTTDDLLVRKEASKGMDEDESEFAVEELLKDQVYTWSDKYRPRKPRYFNRVHTGFEWNKYNQTHYDIDNPPPKVVQGYKFNIFYPDVIDKNQTPKYFLSPCPENKDFSILRFQMGPPYEDIAFKIVNREWEFSYKRGYRCQFQNKVFQLWFHFKRYRYRR